MKTERERLIEPLYFRTSEEILRLNFRMRALGQILSRNCEKYISFTRSSLKTGNETEDVKRTILEATDLINKIILGLKRKNLDLNSYEFFKGTSIFDVCTSSDDFDFMTSIVSKMNRAAEYFSITDSASDSELNRIVSQIRAYYPVRSPLFSHHENLLRFDPNYEFLKSRVAEFKDFSDSWFADRLDTTFAYYDAKSQIRQEAIVIEGISAIPENLSTESFLVDFIERHELTSKFIDENKAKTLHFFILLNKIKFKRAAIKAQSLSPAKINEFLQTFAVFLVVMQEIGINLEKSKGGFKFPGDTKVSVNLEPLKKMLVNTLDAKGKAGIIMRIWKGLSHEKLSEFDFEVARISEIYESCTEEELGLFVRNLFELLYIDGTSRKFFQEIQQFAFQLWEKYEQKTTKYLHGYYLLHCHLLNKIVTLSLASR